MASSPLRSLPAEIRNIIWEYALHEPAGILICTEPGLLRACRAIRKEAELMFYAVNHFKAQVEEDYVEYRVCEWLEGLSDQKRKLIRGLEIHCVIQPATMAISEVDEVFSPSEDVRFMQLMHLLDSIRRTEFGRPLGNVVSFAVSTTSNIKSQHRAFDDASTFEELDQMPIEKQECCRAAKFLILWCVYGKEVMVEAMQGDDGLAIAELDRQVQESRRVSRTTARSMQR